MPSARLACSVLSILLTGCPAGDTPAAEPTAAPIATPEGGNDSPAGPFVRVVGTVQDGGLPHAGCTCDRCGLARREPTMRRNVASLAIVLPATRRVYLIDATPDLHHQLELLADVRDGVDGQVDRAPVDGVLLTHAHIGHYLGLALFGYEAIHAQELLVYGSGQMNDFLRANGPWSLLVERRNVALRQIHPGEPIELGDGVRVTPVPVPHRDEYTDTLGFLIEGEHRSLFYVPDTDSWRAWEPSIEERLTGVDVAILDGTFFSADELPGRSIESIGHPLIASSLEHLQPLVSAGGTEIYFSHLNHSNPVLDPESTSRQRVLQLGFRILEEGREFEL